jgi:hypothetical protein
MAVTVRYRNPELETRERERFRLLQHVHDRSRGVPSVALICSQIADDLGLLRAEAATLIDDLVDEAYLIYAGNEPSVSITTRGILYLRRVAGRRSSVRGTPLPRSVETPPRSIFAGLLRKRRAPSCG